MRDFARLARLFRPHAKAALVAVLAMVGVAVFTTLVAYLFGPLFDQVLSPGESAAVKQELAADPTARGLGKALGAAETARKTPVIRWLDDRLRDLQAAVGVTESNRGVVLPVILLVAFVLKNLCAFAAEYRFNAVGLAFVRDVRRVVYERLLGQSGDFHAKNPSGDLISRVTGDVDRIQSLFGTDLADLVQAYLPVSMITDPLCRRFIEAVLQSRSQQEDLLSILGEGGAWLSDFAGIRSYYGLVRALEQGGASADDARRAAFLIVSDKQFPAPPAGFAPLASPAQDDRRLRFVPPARRADIVRWLRAGSPLARRMHRNTSTSNSKRVIWSPLTAYA